MRLKPYAKCKDSGIEWIEKIPEDWKTRKIKHFSKIFTGSTPQSSNDSYWNGEIIWLTPLDLNKSGKFVSSSKRKITEEGFLKCGTSFINKGAIILATRAPIGYPKITNAKLCFNQGCKAFEIEKEFIADYCYYYFVAFEDILKSKGNATTFSELSTYDLASFLVLKPPIKEQNIIAYHLDKKTVEIDELIEKDKRLIELLKEKRIALINHVVTKGLNPNIKMKDSGIEWIGEIPEDWEVKKLKTISEIVLGKMLTNEDKGDYELKPYLRAQNILWEIADVTDIKNMWFSKSEIRKYKLKKDDLLVSEGGEAGRTAIWNGELSECYIQNSVHKLTINNHNFPRYILYLFESYGKKGILESMVNRVSIAHLTREKIKEIYCIIPPLLEQTTIANFLDKTIEKIDHTIQKIQKKIKLLEEYKKSLIHHVVTGKIDVREAI